MIKENDKKSEVKNMYRNLDDIVQKALKLENRGTIAICGADDDTMVHLAAEASSIGLCDSILVGDETKIRELLKEYPKAEGIRIIDEKDRVNSCKRAVKLVSSNQAQVFVKGNVNTSDFLRAVLDKEVGLRTGHKLNVLTCYEIPGWERLLFMADGGMIVAPDLEAKADILHNCIPILHRMGIRQPKVAILAANEKVSPSMPATVDADELVKMAERGELPEGIYEGPMALDVILRKEAAKKKGIESRVSGEADFILVPSIETGNCLGKSIGYFGKGVMAGIVTGAAKPVIMASRAATIKSKLASVAWALLGQ